jgi:hypothetical protein
VSQRRESNPLYQSEVSDIFTTSVGLSRLPPSFGIVIAGLDPAIHPPWEATFFFDGCAGQARA